MKTVKERALKPPDLVGKSSTELEKLRNDGAQAARKTRQWLASVAMARAVLLDDSFNASQSEPPDNIRLQRSRLQFGSFALYYFLV